MLYNIDVGPGDGDLGTDFSGMINERKPNKEKKPTAEELPEIAENVDETDYYNAVSLKNNSNNRSILDFEKKKQILLSAGKFLPKFKFALESFEKQEENGKRHKSETKKFESKYGKNKLEKYLFEKLLLGVSFITKY